MKRRGVIYACLGILLIFSFGFQMPKTEAQSDLEINLFLPGANSDINTIKNFEQQLGIKFTSLKWYQDWPESIDTSVAKRFSSSGYIPELTWQPQNVSYDNVATGQYDNYLKQSADQVKGLNFPIRISLAPEMNTDWVSWGTGKNGNNDQNHKAFWQHVVTIFRENGADNVSWIWSPNVRPWNAAYNYSQMYPGDQYVDFLGLDGYNWGTSQSWSEWQTFSQVFKSSYSEITGVSGKPILIMEVASTELGGNKAQWIDQMFDEIKNHMTRIRGFTWFNINKETDWRIDSSQTSKDSFVSNVLGKPYTSGSNNQPTNDNQTNKTKTNSNKTQKNLTEPATNYSDPTVLTTDDNNQTVIQRPIIDNSRFAGSYLGESNTQKQDFFLLYFLMAMVACCLIFGLGYLTSRVSFRYQSSEHPKKATTKQPRYFDSLSQQSTGPSKMIR